MRQNLILAASTLVPLLLVSLGAGPSPATESPSAPPDSPSKPVTDRYFDVEVTDGFRWLEDWTDPAVRTWSERQNGFARFVLDGLPGVAALRDRVRTIARFPSSGYSSIVRRGKTFFAIKNQPPRQQSFLVILASPDDPAGERAVVDPNAIDPRGGTAIDWFVPSFDGRLVAVSLSEGGSEAGSLRVYETATGRALADAIPRVNGGTAGGDVAWNGDGTGFLLHALPPGRRARHRGPRFLSAGLLPQARRADRRRRLRRGEGVPADRRDDPRIVRGRPLRARLRQERRRRRRVAVPADFRREVGPSGGRRRARRRRPLRVRRLPLPAVAPRRPARPDPAPRGGPDGPLVGRASSFPRARARSRASASPRTGSTCRSSSAVRRDSASSARDGQAIATLPILPTSSVSDLAPAGDDAILFQNQSALVPPAWYPRFGRTERSRKPRSCASRRSISPIARSSGSGPSRRTGPACRSTSCGERARSSTATTRPFSTATAATPSARGRPIPPCAASGSSRAACCAVAGLRGGGEFGEDWHRAGHLHPQAERLRRLRRLRPAADRARLHEARPPRASRAAPTAACSWAPHSRSIPSSSAPSSRTSASTTCCASSSPPTAQFNVTEFGTVKNPEQFRALYAYSPYHHVKDGCLVPAGALHDRRQRSRASTRCSRAR